MMSNLHWLTEAQMERLKDLFPMSQGKPHGGPARAERDDLHQQQWLEVVRCAARIGSAQNALRQMEAMGRHGHLCPDDGDVGFRRRRREGSHDHATYP